MVKRDSVSTFMALTVSWQGGESKGWLELKGKVEVTDVCLRQGPHLGWRGQARLADKQWSINTDLQN